MNTKRTYLDTLNAGRQRRSDNAIEEINRTLDDLAERLENALQTRETAGRGHQPRAQYADMPRERAAAGYRRDHARQGAQDANAGNFRTGRLPGGGLDMRREEMQAVDPGIHEEIGTLRKELEGLLARQNPSSSATPELNTEFDRLSDAIALLAERSDDRSAKMLRLEVEQMRAALAKLAREETVRSLGKRWDKFETRFSSGLQDRSDSAMERLAARLDEIGAAVASLPDSLSLRSLDERMQHLTRSLEQLAGQRNQNQTGVYELIEERLDEISRAISASNSLAHSRGLDGQLIERVEARISSLGKQIDELVQDRDQGADIILERLTTLSSRVDDIARRVDIPEQTLRQLVTHLAKVSDKIGAAPDHGEADRLLGALEDRFAEISELIEKQQDHSIRQEKALFKSLEQRLDDIAERIEHSSGQSSGPDLRSLEERLDDIAGLLQDHAAPASGLDPEIVQELAHQVANLSALVESSSRDLPGYPDVAPRLENLQQSFDNHRAEVTKAIRQAAAQATQQLAAARDGAVDDELRQELKTLETLTRRSDERSARAFEAIHDTLLKIVSRLGDLQANPAGQSENLQDRVTIDTPSIDPAEGFREAESASDLEEVARTPAEAAAAAAKAALNGEVSDADEENQGRKMLGGLSRALSGRRGRTSAVASRKGDESGEAATENEPELDLERINEPLEPGSGAPDLNTILRRVRDEGGMREQDSADTAKSDFIAAARRAAKAAAAEAEMHKRRQASASDKDEKLSLGSIVRGRKKSLLMLAGAAVVVAGGLHFSRSMLFSDVPADPAQVANSVTIQPEESGGDVAQTEAAPQRAATSPSTNDGTLTAAIPARPVDTPKNAVPSDVSGTADTIAMPQASQTVEAEPLRETTVEQKTELGGSPSMELPEIPSEVGPVSLREAAADGQAEALYEIGNRYAEGREVAADVSKAAEWYRLAAEQGLAPAQSRLGNLYEKGLGVDRDITEAKMWYQLAAQQGNASAMHNLGVLFAMGADGVADNESAARWFLNAAELGLTDSQVNLGILSAKGIGIPHDLTEAYKWFAVAAMSGDKDAAAKRDEIAQAMAPADLAKAEAKAKLWQAHQPDPVANVVEIPDSWKANQEITTASVDMTRAIANAQLILNNNGYDAGPADGIMGDRTRAAIMAFQEQNSLPVTGEIDDAFVRALLQKNEPSRQ